MRLIELFEDGRIVRGVNTTVDVGEDEIQRQAKKFGFTVSVDGEPPLVNDLLKKKLTKTPNF